MILHIEDEGTKLCNIAFTLYERDKLNGNDKNICIDDRIKLIIDAYEKHKHKLEQPIEFNI